MTSCCFGIQTNQFDSSSNADNAVVKHLKKLLDMQFSIQFFFASII